MNTDLFLSFEQQLKNERGYKKELDFKAYKNDAPDPPAQKKETYSAWGNTATQDGFTPSAYNQSQMNWVQSVTPQIQSKLFDTNSADSQARAYADNLKAQGLKSFKADSADLLGSIQSNNAKRFGSLSNSDYDSQLNSASKQMASSLADIDTQYDANYQNALNNYQNYYTNMLAVPSNISSNLYNLSNGLSQNALNSSNATNNFNMTGYQGRLQAYAADQAQKAAMYNALGNSISGVAGGLGTGIGATILSKQK